MSKKKSTISYVGIPQAQLDAAVQDYLARTNQLPTVNSNQQTADRTFGWSTKTIIPKIYPSSILIVETNTASGLNNNDIYEVPVGKIFILLHGSLDINSTTASTGRLRYSNNGGVSFTSLVMSKNPAGTFTKASSLDLTEVLLFPAGTLFNVSNTGTGDSIGIVIGYEIELVQYTETG